MVSKNMYLCRMKIIKSSQINEQLEPIYFHFLFKTKDRNETFEKLTKIIWHENSSSYLDVSITLQSSKKGPKR